jgi:hypothetical protein
MIEEQPMMLHNSERTYHLRGSAREIGLEMGRALGERLKWNIDHYMSHRQTAREAIDKDQLISGALPWLRGLPIRFQQEFEGLAEGAGLPLQRLAEWAFIEQCMQYHCSGFIYRLNGQVWVGRNNDFAIPDLWGYLTIREIEGRIPTMSFCMQGDVFTPTGYNCEKLWLHCHYLPVWDQPRADRPRLPSYVFLPEALETCATIGAVESLLCQYDREDGMMLFAIDGKTNEFAIFECSCHDYIKRTSQEQWLVGTNHCCTRNTEPPSVSSLARYCRIVELVGGFGTGIPQINIPTDLIAILADDQVEARCLEYGTVYAIIACPGSGEIWYTFGGFPAASNGDWRGVVMPW